MLQAVIIEDTVIDMFNAVYSLDICMYSSESPWDSEMETEISVILYVDCVSIVFGRTCFSMRAEIYVYIF